MNDGESFDNLTAPEKRSQAILLVAHGSTKEPETGYSTRRLRTELFYRNPHHVVEAAFWKEEPALDIALANTEADDIYILPMLMSDGFFFRENFPSMLGISEAAEQWQEVGQQRVFYDTPIGESSLLIEVLLDAIATGDELIAATDTSKTVTPRIILVGHGTPRSKRSTREVHRRVDEIRERLPDRRVSPSFIDDEPNLAAFKESLDEPAIVIPWFIADGMHPRKDIPELLGLEERRPEQWRTDYLRGEPVALSPAIGASSFFRGVIESSARTAFSMLAESANHVAHSGESDPESARETLRKQLTANDSIRLGDVRLKHSNGEFELTASDNERATATPEEFEKQALHLRTKHAPVPVAQPLNAVPDGFTTNDFYTACHALETYYPGAIVQWARTAGGIPPESFALYTSTLPSRISGKAEAPKDKVKRAVSEVCERFCERTPIWLKATEEVKDNLPCRTPCHAIYSSESLSED